MSNFLVSTMSYPFFSERIKVGFIGKLGVMEFRIIRDDLSIYTHSPMNHPSEHS